ncbi:MAG: hypothetical protein KBT04_05350, partial [Bacteroidales bacterium]|nr:hypothetical protein [Candidatus Colimorpha onthohippi]
MKYFGLLLLLLLLVGGVSVVAQNQEPVRLSVLDIASDYGIPSNYLKDTNIFISRISSSNTDYVSKASRCAQLSTRVQTMLVSLTMDYPKSDDGLVWLDTNRVVTDLDYYVPRMHQLSLLASRYSQQYLNLEHSRQTISDQYAKDLSDQESVQRQSNRNISASMLLDSIAMLHEKLTNRCLHGEIKDKDLLRDSKDIYYAYLAVYNRIDVGNESYSHAQLRELQLFLDMQNDMLIHVVSDTNYTYHINQFQSQLKNYAGDTFGDVYRSYVRNFSHTSAPIVFRNVEGYNRYVQQLKDIQIIQSNYIKTIDLRRVILKNNDSIVALLSKDYKEMLASYQQLYATVNQIPAFNRLGESHEFVRNLAEFIRVQQMYISSYYRLEQLGESGREFVRSCPRSCAMLKTAYLRLPDPKTFVPHFTNMDEFEIYNQQLNDFEQLQSHYYAIVALRDSVARLEQQIVGSDVVEKVYVNGYKSIKDNMAIISTLQSSEQVDSCMSQLLDFIEVQQYCLRVLQQRDLVASNDAELLKIK